VPVGCTNTIALQIGDFAQPGRISAPHGFTSTCCASTAATTTNTGHTARSSSYRRAAATQRRRMQLLTYVVATSSADSSTNTTPPEFANPTGEARPSGSTRPECLEDYEAADQSASMPASVEQAEPRWTSRPGTPPRRLEAQLGAMKSGQMSPSGPVTGVAASGSSRAGGACTVASLAACEGATFSRRTSMPRLMSKR
jgi:hypothetical protein